MRCLVTGASGHLGSSLVRHLLDRGATVYAMLRPASNPWRIADVLNKVHIIRGDLEHVSDAAQEIHQAAPDTLFHLAWAGITSEARNSSEQITLNVAGSLRLFEIAQAAGCRNWIGVGSQAEYGPYNCPLSEDLRPQPQTAYGVAKLSLGLLLGKLCALSDMRFVWFRLLATYGPKDDPRHLIPSVIVHLLQGRRPLLTSCEQLWDYLYIDDAVAALSMAAANQQARGTYLLGSGQSYPLRVVVEGIRDLIDPTSPLGIGEIPYSVDQVMHLEANIGRLQSITGWSPTTSLARGLEATVAWYRRHGEGRATL